MVTNGALRLPSSKNQTAPRAQPDGAEAPNRIEITVTHCEEGASPSLAEGVAKTIAMDVAYLCWELGIGECGSEIRSTQFPLPTKIRHIPGNRSVLQAEVIPPVNLTQT